MVISYVVINTALSEFEKHTIIWSRTLPFGTWVSYGGTESYGGGKVCNLHCDLDDIGTVYRLLQSIKISTTPKTLYRFQTDSDFIVLGRISGLQITAA